MIEVIWILLPLINSWIIIRILLCIVLKRTPIIDCQWVGAGPKLNPQHRESQTLIRRLYLNPKTLSCEDFLKEMKYISVNPSFKPRWTLVWSHHEKTVELHVYLGERSNGAIWL